MKLVGSEIGVITLSIALIGPLVGGSRLPASLCSGTMTGKRYGSRCPGRLKVCTFSFEQDKYEGFEENQFFLL
jgi:hypothetical protein